MSFLSETKTASSRFWTQVADFISYDDKRYTKCAPEFSSIDNSKLCTQLITLVVAYSHKYEILSEDQTHFSKAMVSQYSLKVPNGELLKNKIYR